MEVKQIIFFWKNFGVPGWIISGMFGESCSRDDFLSIKLHNFNEGDDDDDQARVDGFS